MDLKVFSLAIFNTLFSFFFLALNLKEIPYDIKPISLIKGGGEQHSNIFRDVNPMEHVPALQIDGHTLIESVGSDKSQQFLEFLLLKIL